MRRTNHNLIVFFLIFGLSAYPGCQKDTETTDESPQQGQLDLVQAMDEYHRVLRPLMHQALPNKDLPAFKENSAALLTYAERLNDAQIPAKFEEQESEITAMTGDLLKKTRAFHDDCQAGNDDRIFDSFMEAHDTYETLADLVYRL